MKETLYDLTHRRSTRAYTEEVPSREILDQILEAGTFAPTGRGLQSPRIVVVRSKETIRRIERLNAAVLGDMEAHPFFGAPVVAIVLADPEIRTHMSDGNLVMGNLLNAAQALGVASCYIFRAKEVFEGEEGKALLREWGIPERYVGIGNCLLGYAAEEPRPPKPRKPDYITFVD